MISKVPVRTWGARGSIRELRVILKPAPASGRWKEVRQKSLGAAILALGLLLGGTMAGAQERVACGDARRDPRFPEDREYIVFWECPEEMKKSIQNAEILNAMLNAFWRIEYRLPQDLEEFLNSPFFVVRREDLWNPYQNRRVEFLTEEEAEQILSSSREVQESRLGDIVLRRSTLRGTGEPAMQFSVFVKGFWWAPDEIYLDPSGMVGAPDVGSVREAYEEDRQRGWYDADGLTPSEKSVYAVCHVLDTDPTQFYLEAPAKPARISDWAPYQPMMTKLLNPYTGGYIQETEQPSPGNYITYFGKPFGMQPLCYDGESRIVKPLRGFYEMWRDSELIRLALGFEPDETPFPPGL